VEERKAQARSLFNWLAPDYDVAGPGCFAYFGEQLVQAVGIGPGQQVLDVACGRGAVLLPAAQRTGPSGRAVGIDLSDQMVSATLAEARGRGLAVEASLMDAEHLDFPDATFDRVLCGFGIMFFPRLQDALAEVRRVLKPDGRLGVSTWQVSQVEDLGAVLAAAGIALPPQPGWVSQPEQLARLLTEAGLADVDVQASNHAFTYASLDQYWQNARGTGLRMALDKLDTEQAERVRASLADRLRPYQSPDAGVSVPATALLATANR
jgi:ubiquinone/menaquinone biosynthesis C-methylase UbiE